jgi:hypothetical protein
VIIQSSNDENWLAGNFWDDISRPVPEVFQAGNRTTVRRPCSRATTAEARADRRAHMSPTDTWEKTSHVIVSTGRPSNHDL